MPTQMPPVGVEVEIESIRPDSDPPPPAPDFTKLFESESDYVWHTLRRLGIRERDLEDLVHDVFVVVHRHLGDFDPRRPVRPWLFGIAFRVAAGYRRLARTQREQVSDHIEAIDPMPAADELVATKQAQAIVQEALEIIDLDRRAILLMYEFDGHSMPEIAQTLGIPLNTAYSRLRLARDQFAAACRRLQLRKGGQR